MATQQSHLILPLSLYTANSSPTNKLCWITISFNPVHHGHRHHNFGIHSHTCPSLPTLHIYHFFHSMTPTFFPQRLSQHQQVHLRHPPPISSCPQPCPPQSTQVIMMVVISANNPTMSTAVYTDACLGQYLPLPHITLPFTQHTQSTSYAVGQSQPHNKESPSSPSTIPTPHISSDSPHFSHSQLTQNLPQLTTILKFENLT